MMGLSYDGLEILNCITVIKDVKIRLWQYLKQRLLHIVDSVP